mgnify:CR=1 FL=1
MEPNKYLFCEFKKMLFILFATVLLLSMTACNGYNGIMREHLSNEENYYDVDAIFCSYEKVDDRIYLYVTVEDKSAFDSSESNKEELRLELVGDNCDVLCECLANNEMREGDKLAVKCSTWIYMDSTFYYIAEIKSGEKTFLSFDDGLKNIIKYIAGKMYITI